MHSRFLALATLLMAGCTLLFNETLDPEAKDASTGTPIDGAVADASCILYEICSNQVDDDCNMATDEQPCSLIDGKICQGAPSYTVPPLNGASTQNARDVIRLYCGLSDRTPDPAGFDYWVQAFNTGANTPLELSTDLLRSDFKDLTGNSFQTDTEFVASLYQLALDRDVDAEADYWLTELETRLRADVAEEILRGDEPLTSIEHLLPAP